MTCLGQDGTDLVGPDASQGPDGIQDLHLQLSGLAGSGQPDRRPGSRRLRVGDRARSDRGGAGGVFPVDQPPAQGDLYINPQVKSDLPPPGGTLPLGGSTGSLIQLANGMRADRHDRLSGPDQPRRRRACSVSDLVSATDPMPAIARSRQRRSALSGRRRRPGRHRPVLRARIRAPGRDGAERRHFRRRDVQPGGLGAQRPGWARLGQHGRHAGAQPCVRDPAGRARPTSSICTSRPRATRRPPSGSTAPTMLLQRVDARRSAASTPRRSSGGDWNLSARDQSARTLSRRPAPRRRPRPSFAPT